MGFITRETRLLVPVALALLFLPSVVSGLAMPKGGFGIGIGADALLLIALTLIAFVGQIAISRLALGHREPVGAAIRDAAMRLPALLGALLIAGVPLGIGFALVMGVAALLKQGGGNPVVALLLVLAGTIFLVAAIIVGARCLLNTAIAAVEPGGPVHILKRGFALTQGHALKLLGAALLIAIGGGIAVIALTSVVGLGVRLLLGPPEAWTVAALLVSLVAGAAQAVFSVLFTVLLARLYAQLAAGEASVPSSAI